MGLEFSRGSITKDETAGNSRLNKFVEALESHYSRFGINGVLLLLLSIGLAKQVKVRCSVPGFRYPVFLRLRTTDVLLFFEILSGLQYDCDLGVRPRVILDAGANIGLASVFYANKYPEATIIAIEPEASNFEMLRANTASYQNITILRAALWNQDCDLHIVDPGDGHWDSFGFRTTTQETSDTQAHRGLTRSVTMDRLMKDYGIDHIDLFKVDIEGAEKEVFESPAGWIDRVGAIAIELHDRFKDGCSDSVSAATVGFNHKWTRGEITFMLRQLRSPSEPVVRQRPLHLPVKISWSA